MDLTAASDYLAREAASVKGWLGGGDGLLFCAFGEMQAKVGLHGDILEIGAYEGRSAILLAYLLQPDEHLMVCDLFGRRASSGENTLESADWYGGLTRKTFEMNYLRFHGELPIIHSSPSDEVCSRYSAQQFRMIHIDGSHLYDQVKMDLQLAKRSLLTDGIVAVDDFRSAHTPGVSAAVWEEIIAGGLVPICVTTEKLYGRWAPALDQELENLAEVIVASGSLRCSTDTVMGRRLLIVLPENYGRATGNRVLQAAKAIVPESLGRLFKERPRW